MSEAMIDCVRSAPALEELHILTSDAKNWLYDELFEQDVDTLPQIMRNPKLKKILCRGTREEERLRELLKQRNVDTRLVSMFEFEADPMEELIK